MNPISPAMGNTVFWLMLEAAMIREARLHQPEDKFGSEENPTIYGNVKFWKDTDGNWCYDKPTSQWDSAAITASLQYWF